MPRRLTRAVLAFFFFCLQTNLSNTAMVAHSFSQEQHNEINKPLIAPYLILKSPWEAVKVSELCCSCVGAALAKQRVILYVR